jgi:hypothetical protein
MESLSNSAPQNFDKCFLFYQIHLQTFSLLINHEFSPSDHIKMIVHAINSKCKSLKIHIMELEHAITNCEIQELKKKAFTIQQHQNHVDISNIGQVTKM